MGSKLVRLVGIVAAATVIGLGVAQDVTAPQTSSWGWVVADDQGPTSPSPLILADDQGPTSPSPLILADDQGPTIVQPLAPLDATALATSRNLA
ncbi:hypothetical protein ACH4CE_17175 [Streptomyces gelaticus]|uniref:hypothetical protein n=1 Tax=Streptomyces gelaticus TaxID=285446 RepID=UPI0037A88006